jgi:hypothetical protein
MRSVLALLAAILLLASTAGGATAARAFKETEHLQDIGCDGVGTPDGTAFFYASLSDIRGTDGYLDVIAEDSEDPENPDIVWQRDFDRPVVMTFGPAAVSVTIPLLPSGEAHVSATLEPVSPIDFVDNGKEGNSKYRTDVVGTFYAVSGTLTLPGGSPVTLDPNDCGASDAVIENFFTRPHASVRTFASNGGSCELINDEGDSGEAFFGLDEDSTVLFLDAFVVDSSGDVLGASGATIVEGPSITIPLDEYDPETGEPTGATGSAAIALDETPTGVAYVLRSSNLRVRVSGSVVGMDGTLTTSFGSFSLDSCVLGQLRSKEILTPSNGPKPSGKAPVNDLPSGAITLRPGSKANTSTRGAQVPSETGYPCMVFEDGEGSLFTVPVEHTVWYRVNGTGQPITVDTGGSDFDTVVAVYAGVPDEAATVGCVDDAPLEPVGRSLQAAVTVPTTAGTTYWIQIGGYQEGEGVPLIPYGNLRVSVR